MGVIIAYTSYSFVCCEDPVACKQALKKWYWLSQFTPVTLLSPEPTGLTVAGGNGEAARSLAMDNVGENGETGRSLATDNAGGNGEAGRSLAMDNAGENGEAGRSLAMAGPPSPHRHKALNCSARKLTLGVGFHLPFTVKVHGRARREIRSRPRRAGQ